jgi:HEAT repeat protein
VSALGTERRAEALILLRHVGGPEAARPIAAILVGLAAEERTHALRALGAVGGRESASLVAAELGHGSPQVRRAAVLALRDLRALEHGETIVRLPGDIDCGADAFDVVRVMRPDAGEALAAMLASEREMGRRHALALLGLLRPPKAVPKLVELAASPRAEVSAAACEALRRMRRPEAAPGLAKYLGGGPPELRKRVLRGAAATALGEMGCAGDALVKALADDESSARIGARIGLIELRDPATAEAVAAHLRDPRPAVRADAARALGALGRADDLARVVDDPNGDVRAAAVEALGSLGAADLAELIAGRLEDESVDALAAMGAKGSAPAVAARLADANAQVRESAARALKTIGTEAEAEALVKVLRGWDDTADHAADALVAIRPKGITESLLNLVASSTIAESMRAARVACGIGAREALPAILPRMPATGDDYVLPDFGALDADAAVALADVLKDPDIARRRWALDQIEVAKVAAAVEALGQIGAKESSGAILRLLQDREGEVRVGAAAALGRLGAREAARELIRALADREVCHAAAQALGRRSRGTAGTSRCWRPTGCGLSRGTRRAASWAAEAGVRCPWNGRDGRGRTADGRRPRQSRR